MIKAENLKKEFRIHGNVFKILENIDIEINDGDFIAIMGPSGAGKSTLLNILSTIERPTSGVVKYDEKEVFSMKNKELSKFRKDNIGFIFQDYNLIDSMSIEDNIALPMVISGENYKKIEKEVNRYSKFFNLKEQLNKYPMELSGGQKQKVAVARALIANPNVIFADEPTGALDSKSTVELLNNFKKINEELKKTIVMVTHDAFTASYAKKVLFIKDGKINLQLNSDGNRKEFFDNIMTVLSSTGGVLNEIV